MTDARPEDVQSVYDRRAEGFDATRSRAFFEARWMSRFADMLPPGASVLDLGCGTGAPISDWLTGEGFRVTGVDFSEPMLAIARQRRPDGDWRMGDMRGLDLGQSFAGIVAWNSFFHLDPDAQRATLPRLAQHLDREGLLMVTVGPDAGETTGTVEGDPVYHASLSPAEYAARLEDCGMRLVAYMAEDPYCAHHSILMARRST